MSTGRHAPDEDRLVARVCLHAQAIAEHGASGKRARGINRHDSNAQSRPSKIPDEAIDECAHTGMTPSTVAGKPTS